MLGNEQSVDEIIESQGLQQVTDSGAIEKLVDDVIAANPEQVAQFRAGKEKVFAFFIGQAMKVSKGKANPDQLNALLLQKLKG
jgi:aspartyl-tRNA(Asn)/glutamyl-tRNA(Gln) amidotransferase subunit B